MQPINANKIGFSRRDMLALSIAGTLVAAFGVRASAIASPVDLTVIDRDVGSPLNVWSWHGQRFVAGAPGSRYSLRLTNNTPQRMLAVVSVDGVNVMTGETASYDQAGYILDPYQTYEVTGWRKSLSQVAAFNFTALGNSYAARTGRPSDVGVIGMAVFNERPAPQAAAAGSQRSLRFEISRQDAPTALAAWSAASGIRIDAPASLTRGVSTNAVSGSLDPRDALDALIANTKLVIIRDDGDTISLGATGADTVSSVNVTATGTAVAGVKAVGSPVQRLSKEDLLKTGATSLHDALSSLPALQSSGGAAQDYGLVKGSDSAASRAAPIAPPRQSAPLGTGYGAVEPSVITWQSFVRATPAPMLIAQIQYDSYANLVAKGVIPPTPPTPRQPRAFPNQSFVPAPPR